MPAVVYSGVHREVVLEGVVCKRGEPVTFPRAITDKATQQSCWRLVKSNPKKGA